LLYSRFIFKFLWDIGAVPKIVGSEPYKKRTSHGMVLGEGGIKMSKSKGNVINPDKVVKECGADTLRVYEMFMGPFEQMIPWDTKGVVGARRFIEKIYNLSQKDFAQKSDDNLRKILHKTIKKVSEDVDALKFNTSVSSMMEFVNAWQVSKDPPRVDERQRVEAGGLDKKDLADFLKILSPFVPHLAEEIWSNKGFKGLCCEQKWPKHDEGLIKEEKVLLIVQVNGKVRDKIEIEADIDHKKAEKIVLSSERIKNLLGDKKPVKTIFVANKLINIVI
jgi:leucyl-tRNA synthetase